MKKMYKIGVILAATLMLSSCPVINLNPTPKPGDLTVDHSICNNSAFEIAFGSPVSVLASQPVTAPSTAINACYGVGGSAIYYAASSFVYQRSREVNGEGKYTYYVVSSNSGILHRFVHQTPPAGSTLSKENITTLTDGVYEITFESGRRYAATYLGRHDDSDLVIFTIQTSDDLPWVNVGSSDDLVIGSRLSAIGTPILGVSFINTAVQGVVSGLNRRYSYTFNEGNYNLAITDHPTFQFDAPINPGMEGGPVFNELDELVGMITYKYETSTESLSLALPIDDVLHIINSIIQSPTHTFQRVLMGVSVYDLEQFPQNAIMTSNGYVSLGVYVNEVSALSAANLAQPSSMVSGEIMTGITISGRYFPITNITSLTGKLWRLQAGDSVIVETKVANSSNTAIITKTYTITFGG